MKHFLFILFTFFVLSPAFAFSPNFSRDRYFLTSSDGQERPTKIAYKPTHFTQAKHCVLCVEDFEVGEFSRGMAHRKWIKTMIVVDPTLFDGKILNAGVYMEWKGLLHAENGRGYFLALTNQPNEYSLQWNFESRGREGIVARKILGLEFFVDILKESGEVERIIFNNNGTLFSLNALSAACTNLLNP